MRRSIKFYDAQGTEIYKQYCEPVTYIAKTTGADFKVIDQHVALPGEIRYLRFKPGYGSSNFSVGFAGCLITQLGQTTDREIPQTISSLASMTTVAAGALRSLQDRVQTLEQGRAANPAPAIAPPVCAAKQEFYRVPVMHAGAPDFTINGIGTAMQVTAAGHFADVGRSAGPSTIKKNQ